MVIKGKFIKSLEEVFKDAPTEYEMIKLLAQSALFHPSDDAKKRVIQRLSKRYLPEISIKACYFVNNKIFLEMKVRETPCPVYLYICDAPKEYAGRPIDQTEQIIDLRSN